MADWLEGVVWGGVQEVPEAAPLLIYEEAKSKFVDNVEQ
jgi:hypothetical protein